MSSSSNVPAPASHSTAAPVPLMTPSSGFNAITVSIKKHFGLWLMAILGLFLILFFGFRADWLNAHGYRLLGAELSHAEWWEFGAIFWSLLFGIYYYFTFEHVGSDWLDRLLGLVASLGTIVLCIFAGFYLHTNSGRHLAFVLAIGGLFLVTDTVLFIKHKDPDNKKTYLESILVADAPMIVGLATLFLFQIAHASCPPPSVEGIVKSPRMVEFQMQIFLGGAISFQLIVSNVVFMLSQFGVLRKIWQP